MTRRSLILANALRKETAGTRQDPAAQPAEFAPLVARP